MNFSLLQKLVLSALVLSFSFNADSTKKASDPLLQVREEMVVISRQLGVTCTHCHNMSNLKSDEKKAFRVSLDHMRIVDLLNKKGFRGKPKVDCYLCHRGQLKPRFREDLGHKASAY